MNDYDYTPWRIDYNGQSKGTFAIITGHDNKPLAIGCGTQPSYELELMAEAPYIYGLLMQAVTNPPDGRWCPMAQKLFLRMGRIRLQAEENSAHS